MIQKLQTRASRASSIVELPLCMFLLLFVFVFPMVDLATITLRVSAVYAAVNNAASKAARAASFSSGTASSPSVRQAARTRINEALAGASSLPSSSVRVYILGTPLRPGLAPIRQETPLAQVSRADYLYEIEVELQTNVDPLIKFNSSIFGNVPGLSQSLPIRVYGRHHSEHPSGLSS